MPLINLHIEHLAQFPKLELTLKEPQKLIKDLAEVIAYLNQIKAVSINYTDCVSDCNTAFEHLRTDEVRQSLSQDQMLQDSSLTDGEFFMVPKVMG